MADRYLLESGAPDGYLLEDSSGVLLLEDMPPFANEIAWLQLQVQPRPGVVHYVINNVLPLTSTPADTTTILRDPLFVNKRVSLDIPTPNPVVNLLETTLAQVAPTQNPFVNEILPTIQAISNVQPNIVPNLLNTTFTDTYVAVAYPESFPIQPYKQILANTVFPNLLLTTLFTNPVPFVNKTFSAPIAAHRTLLIDAIGAFPILHSLAGVSGSASITEQADTLSATGTTTIVGTSSTTNNNDTSSASGTTTVTGTSSTTNNDDTVSASGSVGGTVTGSANITEQADTVSASGTTTIVGTSSTTNNNDTVTATGTTTITGTSSTTNNNDTVSASGFVGTPPSVTTYLPLTGVGH